jgi:23S rRNA (guanosine2251-2'-O)-methyltransferase
MPEIIIIAHNIRSTHNIGALFRTAEGFGVQRIILSGYTPYPHLKNDARLPYIAEKLTNQIHKTALGAELLVPFEYSDLPPIEILRKENYRIVGLEQDKRAIPLPQYISPSKIVLLLGEEVDGISEDNRQQCDDLIEIPMQGEKESFNVSVAAGIALYGLTYSGNAQN